jgi:hypothetical protein
MGRQRELRTEPGELTLDQFNHLVHGWALAATIPDHGTPGFPFKSDEDRRQLWERHREKIMALRGKNLAPRKNFLDDEAEGFPHGTRPSAWWSYDNPCKEPRRQTEGPPVRPVDARLTEGKPLLWYEPVPDARFESQYAYLKRHGLLLEGEEEHVRPEEMIDDW